MAVAGQSVAARMKKLGLCFFSPLDVAALHSFPASFSFPAHITKQQAFACLGNSLSVRVVAALLAYLLADVQAAQSQDQATK